ncbi:MAG TPA: PLP-dependent aminotransferase family protein [Pyrinomonadaceae bacterium]|nr:PLP-dependent aminotransferase family protein [Pyrinomonadaceae bacterium]
MAEKWREPLLYERVAARIERMIENGVLRPGEKVPSVRTISQQQRVSLSTAFKAYYHLEIKGLLEARPRSGFYVRPLPQKLSTIVTKSTPSTTPSDVKIHDLVTEIFNSFSQPDITPLGATSVDERLLPASKLQKFLVRATRQSPEQSLKYDFSGGLSELRRLIARRAATDWGGNLTRDDVTITAGCSEALTMALRVVARPGDSIVIESPSYFGILQRIESLGLKALEIATNPDRGISLTELERVLCTEKVAAVLLVPNFGNPLGNLMPDDKKKAIAEMLARREIPLIEDDICGDLHFGTMRPKPIKTFDLKGLVLLCSSFSKTLAPGYRVGWVAAGRFHEQVLRLKQMTTIGTSLPPQMAISAFLQSGNYDRHLRGLRTALFRQMLLTVEAVSKYFPPKTRVSHPQGGSVLWVELPKGFDSLALYRHALSEKIGIVPGIVFSAQNKYRNFIRLSYGHCFDEKIEFAIEKLGEIIQIVNRNLS